MNKTLIVINGEAGSGKDTFVEFCREYSNKHLNIPVNNLHSSDTAKSLLRRIGWNGKKTEGSRKLLADLVDFADSTGYTLGRLKLDVSRLEGVIFYHQRNPKIISEIKKLFEAVLDIDVTTVLVVRDQNNGSNPLEPDRWGIDKGFEYDFIVRNNKNLEDLKACAGTYINYICKRSEENGNK